MENGEMVAKQARTENGVLVTLFIDRHENIFHSVTVACDRQVTFCVDDRESAQALFDALLPVISIEEFEIAV
jgi:hypothetical protein